MALFFLDTTTVTLLYRNHPVATANFVAHANHVVGVTSVNVEETLGGWYSQIRQAKTPVQEARASLFLAESVAFLARFPIFPLTELALDRYDQLRKLKIRIGGKDLRISALALELGAVVVTNNLRDFRQVP